MAWAVLAGAAVVTTVLGWQARDFRIDASPDTLLTPNNANYVQTRIVGQRFGSGESLVIAYQPRDHELLSAATFEDLRSLSRRLSSIPRVASVRSLLNVPLPGPDADIAAPDALEDSTLEDREPSFAELPQMLAGHPVYEGLLIDREQTVTALEIRFAGNDEVEALEREILDLQRQTLDGELDDGQRERLERLERRAEPLRRELARTRAREMQEVRRIVGDYEDRADLYVGGIHALEQGLIRIIEHDVRVFGVAIAVAICVVLLALFRSIRWMLVPVVTCAVSVACTIGLFVLLGLEVTVVSANFVALQLILTLAIAMHLIVEYRQQAAKRAQADARADARADAPELARVTMERKFRPCLYAGITTSVGFGSLVLSGIEPVISFGWMMIIATTISLAVTLALFPALAIVTRPPVASGGGGRLAEWVLRALQEIAIRRRGLVAIFAVGLIALGGAGAALLELENSFLDYFDESTTLHRDLSFIDRNLAGTTPLDLVYQVPASMEKPDRVLTAEAVQHLQAIHERLEQHPEVGKVLSVTSFTALARRLNDDRPLTETELTAAYRLIPDATREQLVGSFLDTESDQVRFSVHIRDTAPNLDRSALLDAIHGDMQTLGVGREQYSLSNLAVLYDDVLDRLFTSQVLTLGAVFAALGAAFWVSFGSARVALIALVPNVLAASVVFGAMGWLGIPLDVMTITIGAVTLGIAVDDTIHYVHRYRELARTGAAESAVRGTHSSVGLAILYTTAVITLGFSLLTISSFIPTVLFGALTGLAMVIALVADLTLLPVLLRYAPAAGGPDGAGRAS